MVSQRKVQPFKKLLLKSVLTHNYVPLQSCVNQCLFSLRYTPPSVSGVSPISIMLNYKPKSLISLSNPVSSQSFSKHDHYLKKTIMKKVSFNILVF